MRGNLTGIGVAAAGLVLAAACSSNASTAAPATTTTTSGGPVSGSASGVSAGTKVTATLTDFHIALSTSSFKPGTYTFDAVNSGAVPHSLEINGPGVNGQRVGGDIQPGQSGDLTVTLQSGSYDVFCPVPGHKALGMDLTINVSSAGGSVTGSGSMSGMTSTATKSGGSGGY